MVSDAGRVTEKQTNRLESPCRISGLWFGGLRVSMRHFTCRPALSAVRVLLSAPLHASALPPPRPNSHVDCSVPHGGRMSSVLSLAGLGEVAHSLFPWSAKTGVQKQGGTRQKQKPSPKTSDNKEKGQLHKGQSRHHKKKAPDL